MYNVSTPGSIIALDGSMKTMLRTFEAMEDSDHYRRDFADSALVVRIGGRGTPEEIYGQIRDLYLDTISGVEMDGDVAERSPELVSSVRKFIENTKENREPFFVSWEEYPELSEF